MDTLKKHLCIELRSSYNDITLLIPAHLIQQAIAIFEAAVVVVEVDYEGTMKHAERGNIALKSLTPATFTVLTTAEAAAKAAAKEAAKAEVVASTPSSTSEEPV